MGESPLVFAHRGSSACCPSTPCRPTCKALDEGADGVECDVRLTRDGHLVCVHDRRLDRTSNGRGRVSRHTLAELDALDFGYWHRPAPTPTYRADPDRTRLLTLDRLLGAVRDAGREVQVLIETKHPTRHGGDVERALAALLRRHGLERPRDSDPVAVTVMSFSPLAVRRMRELAPGLPTVLLMDCCRRLRRGTLPFGARIAGPGIHLVRARPRLVRTAAGRRQPGLRLDRQRARPRSTWLVDLGVDGIITDRPAFVLEHIGR